MIKKIFDFLFKDNTYSGYLDEYISSKCPQNISELENYIREFEKRVHENGWIL